MERRIEGDQKDRLEGRKEGKTVDKTDGIALLMEITKEKKNKNKN